MSDAEDKKEEGSHKNEDHKITIGSKTVIWPSKTITTEQIAEEGDLNVSDGIIAIKDGDDRVLKPGDVIDLDKENMFDKDHKFRRGI